METLNRVKENKKNERKKEPEFGEGEEMRAEIKFSKGNPNLEVEEEEEKP